MQVVLSEGAGQDSHEDKYHATLRLGTKVVVQWGVGVLRFTEHFACLAIVVLVPKANYLELQAGSKEGLVGLN